MKTIWKFEFSTVDNPVVAMPRGAEILCVQTQRERPCLWALVDPGQPMQDRHLRVYGTGHPVEVVDEVNYIGTYQLHGGSLVFHVFEDIDALAGEEVSS